MFTALLALGAAGPAFAQAVTSDLILGFRDDGSDGGSATTNTTIDLGQVSTFENTSIYSPGITTATGINLVTDGLGTTYGSGFLTDTGLFYGVVGATGNTVATRELYVSANATGSALNGTPNSTPWIVQSTTSQSVQASKFLTLYANNPGGFNGIATIATSDSRSWSSLGDMAGGTAFGAYTPDSAFEQNPVGNAADLYDLNPHNNLHNPAVFLGTFSIDSTGNLDFTAAAAAIPEPATYAAILGAAVLGVALVRRRRHSQTL